jgi:cytochrome c oxidase subunit 2
LAAAAAWAGAGAAYAAQPVDGAIDLQPPATEVARDIISFHHLLLWIIVPVTLFVLVLLIYVMLRYNRAANPTPRKFTHNLFVEVVWTTVPVMILVVIAAFSFPLLFKEELIPKADLTIKATGNMWNWSYSYADQGVEFTANPLQEADAAKAGKPFRLGTDEPMVVPVGSTVHMLITGNDVIHAWGVPAFGVKEDAIPGRVNESWFKVDEPGTYYGQCSELCGLKHSFMPIEVKVVPKPEFEAWVQSKGGQVASAVPPAVPASAPAAPAPAPAPAPAAGQAG